MNTSLQINPYIAGSPVTGTDMFFGREDVFFFVQKNLTGRHRDTPIVLAGQRRTGKTSVLYQIHRHLDSRYRCILIDLHALNLNGVGNLLWGIANSIKRGLQRDHQLRVAVPDRATFLANPQEEFRDTFLDSVWSALGEDHLVLMIDEVARFYDEVQAGRLEREVFDYFRHLMQHFERLNFIFSLGSAVEEMKKDYAQLFAVAQYQRISFLAPAAAHALITAPAQGCYEVMPEAVERVLQITTGHPYYTQLVCHCLFDRWLQVPKSQMTSIDIDAVLADAIELGSPNLTYVWEDSTPEEKAVMAGMAAATHGEELTATIDQIRQMWDTVEVLLPVGDAATAMRNLAAREVVVASAEAYSFTVDLQRLWLEKHRRLDWVKEELAEAAQKWAVKSEAAQKQTTKSETVQKWVMKSEAPFAADVPDSLLTDNRLSKATVTRIPARAVDVRTLADSLRLWYRNKGLEAAIIATQTGWMVQCRRPQASRSTSSTEAALTVILRDEGEYLGVEIGSGKWVMSAAASATAVAPILAAGPAGLLLGIGVGAGIAGAKWWTHSRLPRQTISFLRKVAPAHVSGAQGSRSWPPGDRSSTSSPEPRPRRKEPPGS
jgi:hypothetical protein